MSIISDAITKSLQFVLGGTITTNQLPFSASWVDITTLGPTPGEQDGTSNSTTPVTFMTAPAASTQRVLKSFDLRNADTVNAVVTITYNNNSTLRNIMVVTLSTGDHLQYEDSTGWRVLDSSGAVKQTGGSSSGGDVVGPSSATDKAIARFNSTTGKLIQNSAVTIADTTGVIAGTQGITRTGVSAPAYVQGKLVYDTDNESLTFFNNDSNVSLQIGQEEWIRVVNNTGSTIANGAAVYLSGASGSLPTIALAKADAAATVICCGLTTESIANGGTGYVTSIGVVHGIDTSAFTAGQTVFVSAATAGLLTATAPSAPNFRYRVGIVVVSNASTGSIHVTPSTGALGNGTANQVSGINAAGTGQEYKTIAGATGVNVTHAANLVTITSTLALTTTGSSGAATYNAGTGALNIPQYSGGSSTGTLKGRQQFLTSGTYTPTSGTVNVLIQCHGAGGGGGGGGTGPGGTGGTGGASSVGSLVDANGGVGAVGGSTTSAATNGGAGGAVGTNGTLKLAGAAGMSGLAAPSVTCCGGTGGPGYQGTGSGIGGSPNAVGGAGGTNTGAGGGGAGTVTAASSSAGGGGAGGYSEYFGSVTGTPSVTIGTGGAGGTAGGGGFAGGAGGGGLVVIYEFS